MTPRDAIINTLESMPHVILDLAAEFGEAHRTQRLVAGKWTPLEQLAHLARVDEMMLARLNHMLSHPDQAVVPYDPDEDSPGTLGSHDWDDVAARFGRAREQLVERLRGLDDSLWQRPARHPEYPQYSIHIMTRHLALHDALHGYRLEELLAAAPRP